MVELTQEQNKAVDIIEKLVDTDYDFTNLMIPLIYNFDSVKDYIINNYSDVLNDDGED